MGNFNESGGLSATKGNQITDEFDSQVGVSLLPRVGGGLQFGSPGFGQMQQAILAAQTKEGRLERPGPELYVDSLGEVILAEHGVGSSRMAHVAGDVFAAPYAQANRGTGASSDEEVFVHRNGDVYFGKKVVDTGRMANVPGDTFFSPDLNAIQAAIFAAQANGGTAPNADQEMFVDRLGDVHLGAQDGDSTRMASVAGDTFYARDIALEKNVASTKLPPNAVKVSDGDVEGYSYTIVNKFGDTYTLFIYYAAEFDVYRVSLVSPRLGGKLDVHGGHLYADGTLCLTRSHGSGYPSMEKTYAKSALWTIGASLFVRGYGFQMNTGQDGPARG